MTQDLSLFCRYLTSALYIQPLIQKVCIFTTAVGSLYVGLVYISVTSFTGTSLLKHTDALTPDNNCLEMDCILKIYSDVFL